MPFLGQKAPPILRCDCIASDETVINLNESGYLMLVKLFKQFAARTKKVGRSKELKSSVNIVVRNI